MERIAFFDIDKTILGVNSAKLWLLDELRRGELRWRDAARGLLWASLYGAGLVNVEGVLREAVATLKGRQEAPMRQAALDFYAARVRPTLRRDARRAILEHQARGEAVILITSSSQYIAQCVAQDVGSDGESSNVFEVNDLGQFTGTLEEPLCYGAGKIVHAQRWCERFGVSLERCAFYTDSVTDAPLMERVGRAVAVSPDPRLARLARRRGWAIQDWQ